MILIFFTLAIKFLSVYNEMVYTNTAKELVLPNWRDLYPSYGTEWKFYLGDNGEPVFDADYDESRILYKTYYIYKEVTFTLYTRLEKTGVPVPHPSILNNTTFDRTKKSIFITHGFLSKGDSDTCQTIKDGYLLRHDVNVFIVDWSKIADHPVYFVPMEAVPKVADFYSKYLTTFIITQNVDPMNIHLIGHSLGAHVSGVTGKMMEGPKIGRVTGLDPALPGFDLVYLTKHRISPEDAHFVDVIHSCGGLLGILSPVGHVDFYPNGGVPPQRGCSILGLIESCSHGRSWIYFAESLIHNSSQFYAYPCSSYDDFATEKCNKDPVLMGAYTPPTARGTYYLDTSPNTPYGLGIVARFLEKDEN